MNSATSATATPTSPPPHHLRELGAQRIATAHGGPQPALRPPRSATSSSSWPTSAITAANSATSAATAAARELDDQRHWTRSSWTYIDAEFSEIATIPPLSFWAPTVSRVAPTRELRAPAGDASAALSLVLVAGAAHVGENEPAQHSYSRCILQLHEGAWRLGWSPRTYDPERDEFRPDRNAFDLDKDGFCWHTFTSGSRRTAL